MKYVEVSEADIGDMSPSLRRVWVEISSVSSNPSAVTSPSLRRVWVEIVVKAGTQITELVTLLAEGVG